MYMYTYMNVVSCCLLLCCLLLLVLRLLFVFTHPKTMGKSLGLLPSLRETHEGNAVVVVPFFWYT